MKPLEQLKQLEQLEQKLLTDKQSKGYASGSESLKTSATGRHAGLPLHIKAGECHSPLQTQNYKKGRGYRAPAISPNPEL